MQSLSGRSAVSSGVRGQYEVLHLSGMDSSRRRDWTPGESSEELMQLVVRWMRISFKKIPDAAKLR